MENTGYPTWEEVARDHRWLCHPNGEPCPDGCDTAADPKRLAEYKARGEESPR
jgi:hypothetical protein